MRAKISLILLITLFIIVFLIFYKGLKHINIYTPKISLNESIPSFKANVFQTKNEISSEEIFKGDNYYLLNVWSSWCIPCREEHYFLMKLKTNKKIQLVGLNYKDKEKSAENFLNQFKNPYKKILSDLDGKFLFRN